MRDAIRWAIRTTIAVFAVTVGAAWWREKRREREDLEAHLREYWGET